MDTESLAHPAQPPPEGREASPPTFLYPDPLVLARNRAEAEMQVLADCLTYSDLCRSWGRVGGMTTMKRYGRTYFRLLAKIRHGDAEARLELVLHVAKLRRREGS